MYLNKTNSQALGPRLNAQEAVGPAPPFYVDHSGFRALHLFSHMTREKLLLRKKTEELSRKRRNPRYLTTWPWAGKSSNHCLNRGELRFDDRVGISFLTVKPYPGRHNVQLAIIYGMAYKLVSMGSSGKRRCPITGSKTPWMMTLKRVCTYSERRNGARLVLAQYLTNYRKIDFALFMVSPLI